MYSIRFQSFLNSIKLLLAFGLSIFFIERVLLFTWSLNNLTIHFADTLLAFMIGLMFDASLLLYCLIPYVLLFLLFPQFKKQTNGEKTFWVVLDVFNFFFIFFILHMVTTEIFFWDEFQARFNFIAVDYLLYTTEVLKNIWESYPILKILVALFVGSLLILMQLNKRLEIEFSKNRPRYQKLNILFVFAALLAANYFLINQSFSQIPNQIAYQEISKNGPYSLFYSYFENQINYDQFYIKLNKDNAFENVKRNLPDGPFQVKNKENLKRDVLYSNHNAGKMNVVLVLMESMGARFMNSYGSSENLTPNLDILAKEGLFFNNIYATGTRTVRGIEAITLSIPPTPGQSIVRRPNNEKLVTINSYFAKSGYDVEFLYGGYSYFDNMKYFFENNDARVLDIAEMTSDDNTFSNAWGVSDEDLYRFTIKNADKAYNNKKPFFQIVLTTSNHRPFTYPEGKIDIPSGTGRKGAVKYADYAIGKLIDEARNKPWFNNTLFVFVADHDAGVAGNTDVNKKDYLVPLIFFAPSLIKPQVISNLGSQIDVGPTLMGLLNMSHESFGFGYDLRKYNPARAFISNYQKVGYLKQDFLTLLEPGQKFKQYKVTNDLYEDVDIEKDQLNTTVSFYQTASSLYRNNKLKSKDEKLVITK